MIVRSTTDQDIIKRVMLDEWVLDRVSEDGCGADDLVIDSGAVYLVDSDISGLGIFHLVNVITCQFHIQMLDKLKAMEFGAACLDFIFDNTNLNKIIAQIPEIYPDVCRFTEKHGFKKEGVSEGSYLKNGNISSLIYYGLTRGDHGLH